MSLRIGLFNYSRKRTVQLLSRGYSSKIPSTPVVILEKHKENKVNVDKNTLALLERLSLVKFESAEGVKVLEDSITFANKVLHINTDGVEPLYSVLEEENLSLRSDEVTQGNCQRDILKNAVVVEDDYFVAPPGNIPLHEVEVEDKTSKEINKSKKIKQNEN